jgi:hypothetical protein
MRVIVVLLALASAITFAADDAVTAPQSTASHKPQATSLGTEAITIPQMLSYQGKVTDTLGQPVADTTYNCAFELYTVPSGGTPFWSESQVVRTKGGLFSVLLGSTTPVSSIPDAGAVYLGMQVGGPSELTPRLRIASAAYSYLAERSANADLLQGKDTTALDSRYVNEGQASSVTSNMIVDGTIAAADLSQMGASSGQVMKWTGSVWAPRNDSVGSGGGGTVTSVSQATGAVCSPNPITSTGTVGFDQTYGDGRYERVANKNVASGYCGLDASTKVPNGRLYTGTGNGLDADLLDGSHASAFAPSSGSANYIQNQNSSGQAASFRVTGTGQSAQFYGVSASAGAPGIWGDGGTYAPGVYGTSTNAAYFGVRGDGGTATTGVLATANNASHFGVEAYNNNVSGTGIIASGNCQEAGYLAGGSGGAFTGSGCGTYSTSLASISTGIIGAGNNVSPSTFPTGSGGAFTGLTCGGYGHATQTTGAVCGFYGDVNTSTGFGLSGTNTNAGGSGVRGVGNDANYSDLTAGSGVAGTGTQFGVYGYGTDTTSCGGYFANGHGSYAYVAYYNSGTNYKITGSGTVSTIMATREGKKNLFAPEMPEAYFEDCGEGQLANGHCRVNLEKLFSDCITVNAEHPLKVFVQLMDDCNGVYVKRDAAGFDVYELHSGKSNAQFSWRVLAKWKGNENVRLPEAPGPQPTVTGENPVPVEGKTVTATLPQPVEVKSATTTQPRPVPGLK